MAGEKQIEGQARELLSNLAIALPARGSFPYSSKKEKRMMQDPGHAFLALETTQTCALMSNRWLLQLLAGKRPARRRPTGFSETPSLTIPVNGSSGSNTTRADSD
jgi:hypothetical protein